MESVTNEKAQAWENVGGLFWTLGRMSARPSEAEISEFLTSIGDDSCVMVIGASTKDLVEAAAKVAARVVVLDFSARMIADLGDSLPAGTAELHVVDITQMPPQQLRGTADFVLSDRLINRFTTSEAAAALQSMLTLAKLGGQVCTSVKIGLYEMDHRMIEEAKRSGCLDAVWDAETKTIDFGHSDEVLERAVLPHGDIPREVLLSWYRGRKKETRFDRSDVLALLGQCQTAVEVIGVGPLPDAPSTDWFRLRRMRGV